MMMNNLKRKLLCNPAVSKVKSWLNAEQVHGTLVMSLILGNFSTVTIGELFAYRMIEQDIMVGELSIFTIDFIIVGISLVEVTLGPFISWFGYNNRRMLMLAWNFASASVSLLWLTMPAFTNVVESEYCHTNNIIRHNVTTSPQAAVRLALVIIACIVLCLKKVATLSHGIAYIEEYAPKKTSRHIGILVTFRIVSFMLFRKTMPRGQSITAQAFSVAGSTIGNILQVFLFMPKKVTPLEENPDATSINRDFTATLIRVLRNRLAITHMLGIGLLVAALWGFVYHDADVVKAKYHLNVDDGNSIISKLKTTLQLVVVILSVVYYGIKFSPPILSEFCRFRGIKQATFMSVFGLVFYILLMIFVNCERGYVDGLGENNYVPPECNLACGCVPRWREFSPVCVTDQVKTYLSPCQAGCSSSETVNSIRVFTNCSCVPGNGRATIGACSLNNCFPVYEVHQILFIMIIMTTILALQAHGMLLLRAVDVYDRSVALGVSCAVVSSIAFGFGHLIFLGISAATCGWFEDRRCHFHRQQFPIYIGSTCSVMVILSTAVSIATWVNMKLEVRKQRNESARILQEQIFMDG